MIDFIKLFLIGGLTILLLWFLASRLKYFFGDILLETFYVHSTTLVSSLILIVSLFAIF
jgi:hypothetical protein